MIERVEDIDFEAYHKKGITTLVFDFDGTLGTRWDPYPHQTVAELLKQLRHTFTILIVSNNILFVHQRKHYFDKLRIPYHRSLKPIWTPQLTLENAVWIGDSWLTDGLTSIMKGVEFIRIKKRKEKKKGL